MLGLLSASLVAVLGLSLPTASWAFDTGVSDDRVSLPEGPGSLEGVGENVSVDPNMGLMRYSIPIIVPQGFAGMTPELALRYSSAGSSTMLGMGWSMHSPSIERMTMRGVPKYDETDRFVSDGGNELVRVSETVGAGAPAIYRNRFESDFTRYKWVDRNGGTTGYWQVEYADGRVGFFGADAEGRIEPSAIEAGIEGTFKYHLVEMVDVYGHRMQYSYIKDGAISLVSEISYVFTNENPTYEIRFTYEGRNDLVSDAKGGFDRILSRRLIEALVVVRGQQLRRYALSYQNDALSGRRSRLAQVESFGSNNERYPIVHTFGYSRGLGAQCDDVDCGRPFLTTMVGAGGLGVAFQSGTANLVDINGDALPDLVDASTERRSHRFFLNQLASDGTHTFSTESESLNGEVSAFPLGTPRVQFIDVNGDGFTDLLNGGTTDQKVLLNEGTGDWLPLRDIPGSAVWNGADAELRFMDYDNDMDIDLIRSSATETFVFENDGSFNFTRRDLEPLGVAFSESIQFTDINGDGLLDIVQMQPNQLQYKTNFGRGRFAERFTTLSHPFGQGEFRDALVEDIDSDGYADIVHVAGNTVRYVLNRNGEGFEGVVSLSEAGGVSLPTKEVTTTVLAADMNGNGSVDIVWVGANGSVQYLDLFPIRSHLLTKIENGIGRVTDIAYEPSVQQRAKSAEEGRPWTNPLPHPMVVVSQTDEYDLLTDVHDVINFRYQDGFYDGIERQFRGYSEVIQLRPGDESQVSGRTVTRYDVGRTAPHLNGKPLFAMRESDGRVIDETTYTYGDEAQCPVAEVPTNPRLIDLQRKPIGFPCEVAKETIIKEGATPDQWITKQTRMRYEDGYGNVTVLAQEGVVAVGGSGCAPCERAEGVFGAPCGNQCLGDERYVQRTYVSVDNTGGRWLLNKISREQRFGVAQNAAGHFAEDIYHYDGDAFVGLPEGQLTQGKMTRRMSRVNDDQQISALRQRFDRHGNIIERLDPLGTVGGQTHRRAYVYDEDGLRVVQVDIFNEDPSGAPYRLRRTLQFDLLFDRPTLASAWMKVEGETAVTAPHPTAYTYDVFGRVESFLRPGGDTGASPTVEFAYDLGNPASRLITRRRSQVGGPLDLETVECVDGRGRKYQTRRRIKEGEYIVDGFVIFNLRSQQVKLFQSYISDSAACDSAPPAGVLAKEFRYDGVNRPIETIHPDSDVAGGPSSERRVYEPLRVLTFDGEDNDPASPHHDTPEIRILDGLNRPVAIQRQLVDATATTQIEYDGLGYMTGYVDALGNRKAQTYDSLGRLIRIDDPNSGTSTYEFDDAGNITRQTDGRGISAEMRYDGLNRQIERFDPADREATLITTEWDESPNCEFSRCPNTAGYMVAKTYPGGADFMGYDVRRRRFSMVRVIEGRTYELQNRYDNADRIVERVYPDGRTLAYTFDGASRVIGIPGVIEEVTYTPQGLMDTWRRSNGVVDRLSYDQRLRLASVNINGGNGELLQGIEVARDRANNIVSAADSAVGAMMSPTTYTYDAWYRSTEIQRGDEIDDMSFDLIDNMTQKTGVTYTYDDQRPGAPRAVGGDAFGYDGAGCVTSANGFEHTWDFLGRLVKSDGQAGTVTSVYGADHLRVARHNDGEVTHYVAKDFEVRDGISVIYPRIGRRRVARLESVDYALAWAANSGSAGEGELTAGVAYLRTVANEADHEQWITASARRMLVNGRSRVINLHRDQLDSLVLATGDEGQTIGRRAFGVHGNEDSSTGFVDRYGFTGQEHEPHTNLVRFPHRFLSTQTGQWMSPDPAFRALENKSMTRLPEAVARYSYVLNNPGTHVDPTGLFIGKLLGAAVKSVGKGVKKLGRKLNVFGNMAAAQQQNNENQPNRSLDPGSKKQVSSKNPRFKSKQTLNRTRRDMKANGRPMDMKQLRNTGLMPANRTPILRPGMVVGRNGQVFFGPN